MARHGHDDDEHDQQHQHDVDQRRRVDRRDRRVPSGGTTKRSFMAEAKPDMGPSFSSAEMMLHHYIALWKPLSVISSSGSKAAFARSFGTHGIGCSDC